MEEHQKILVQMLKANMDQRQKFEQRHQQFFMGLHKQQIQFQQFTLQKIELQQKQLEELLVNSLNGKKIVWKRRHIFPEYNL